MGLKSLEIQGFKSFKDKVKLNFDNPITAIVGPNGSGKSNISDAILWVLGEQSAKNLRGNKMQDIIFAGTQKEKPVNFAQVSITFENDLWEDIDYREITVTRRVFRTGESEYLINKSQVRLKDVKELFLNTGIGKEGYSVIGQGKIDEILSTKSEDRRELFEEASGISKQKYIKEQSVKKLEQTNENLLRLEDILSSQIDRISYLKKESSKAKKGMILEEKLKKMEIQKALNDISQLNLKLQDLIEKKSENDKELLVFDKDLAKFDDDKKIISKILDESENDLELKVANLNEIKSQKIKNDSEIKLSNEKLRNSQAEYDRLTKENENYRNEIKQVETKIDNYNNIISNSKIKIEDINDNIEKYDIEKIASEIEHKKKIISSFKDELNEKQNLYTKFLIEKKSKDAIEKEKNREISEIKVQKEQFTKQLESLNKQLNEILEQIDNFEEKKLSFEKQKDVLNSSIDKQHIYINKFTEKISELKDELSKYKNKYIFLKNTIENHEGYNYTVQHFFKKLNPDISDKVIGTLGDLISVDNKFEKCVDAIMAGSFQNIIVENETDGKILIDFLKKHKIGRLTFLPINKIKAKNFPIVSDDLVIGHLNQFIKSEDKIREIIDYFSQKTLVTNTIDDALKVSSRYKTYRVVTLDGDVINNWGSMVGGYKKTGNNSILSSKNELKVIKDKYDYNISELKKTNEQYNQAIVNIEKDKKLLKETIEEIEKFNKKISEFLTDKSETDFNIKFVNSKIDEYNNKILSNSMYEPEKNINENEAKNEIDNIENKLIQLSTEVDILLESYNSNKMNLISLKSEVSSYKRDLNIYNNQLNDAFIRKDYLTKAINDNSNYIESLKNIIAEIKTKKESISYELFDYDSKIEEINREILELKEFISNKKRELSEVDEQIYKTNVNIQKNKLSNTTIIEKALNTTEKLNNLKIDINDLYKINIDTEEIDKNISTSQKEINKLSNDLRNLGSFSIDSIKEYESVKKEFDFMTKNKNDLINSRNDILNAINKLNKEMKNIFSAKFKEINEKFVKIFQQLFNGGYANLKLTEDDVLSSGIEITAQPPGKKLQSLNLLSGGERSLTAVALLFAIFETRPSSFCILDEIDAALDEINIKRYKEYLIKFKEKTQFIIITHRKSTMEIANILYGISMEKDGISKLIKLNVDRREIC